jgi:hypothetical protein
MRFDIQNQLSVAQAFTGGLTVSTNSYQKAAAVQDLSIGRRLSLYVAPTVAAGAGSTWTFELIQSDDAAQTVNVTILNTVTSLAAALYKGAHVEIPMPLGCLTQAYFGFQCSGTGGTVTVTLDVYIMVEDEDPYYRSFPKVVDALV